jgi:S1-C subfamily serine protease
MVRFLLAMFLLCTACSMPLVSTGAPKNFSLVWQLSFDDLGHGSGCPIEWKDGRVYMATAKHVLRDGNPPPKATNHHLAIILEDARTEWTSSNYDLAIVSYRSDRVLQLFQVERQTDPAMGQRLFIVGHPHNEGLLAFQALSCGTNRLSTTVAPGMSGGAVLDERGRLQGIVSSYRPLRTIQGDVVVWGHLAVYQPAWLLPRP